MLREEAIKYLKEMKDECNDTIHKIRYVTKEEAFEMAIQALEQEPSGDLISRDELLKAIDTWDKFGVDDTNSLFRLDNLSLPHYVPYIHYDDVIKCIKGMSSVNPQEPKTGHWIPIEYPTGVEAFGVKEMSAQELQCSECGKTVDISDGDFKYCPYCKARMVEPQESEG